MKVNFYLKNKTTDGRYSVVLIANLNYHRYRYSTNIKVLPREWDMKRQIIKAKVTASVLNEKLNQIANYATDYFENLSLGETPTQQSFKYHMDLATGKKQPDDNSFFGFINRFCLTANKRMNPQGEFISYKTFKKYGYVRDALVDFEKHKRQTNNHFSLTFTNIDLAMMEEFKVYLADVRHLAPNTISRYFQCVRLFLTSARKQNISVPADETQFKSKGEKVENVVLSSEEMDTLFHLDLSNCKRLERVRDMFLIGCYTGLRYSDICTIIRKDCINREKMLITVHQQKTGGLVAIPLHPNLIEILERRNYELPSPISAGSFNKYIKEVAMLAGLNEPVELKRHRGGKRVLTTSPKYKLISCHTARRSFATDLYMRGVPPELIMIFTGHCSREAFYHYICISPEHKADLLREAWNRPLVNLSPPSR